jgi:hypothetical protein
VVCRAIENSHDAMDYRNGDPVESIVVNDNDGLAHHTDSTDDSYLDTKPSVAFPQPIARTNDVAPSYALALVALNLEAPV